MSIHSIGELLQRYLADDATIADLVGTRIYPVRLPQKVTFPAVSYQRISGVRIGHLHGVASAADPRYQIDAWAQTQSAALELGAALRRRLEGFTGTWDDGAGSPSLEVFVQVRFEDEHDFVEPDIHGGLFRHSADYFVSHGTVAGIL
jgi:hypothetical protein